MARHFSIEDTRPGYAAAAELEAINAILLPAGLTIFHQANGRYSVYKVLTVGWKRISKTGASTVEAALASIPN